MTFAIVEARASTKLSVSKSPEGKNAAIPFFSLVLLTEVWHMAHFWVSYGRCTMHGSRMG